MTYELQDSDVCIRSAPADADGYHSLIRTTKMKVRDAAARDGDARVCSSRVSGRCAATRCSGGCSR